MNPHQPEHHNNEHHNNQPDAEHHNSQPDAEHAEPDAAVIPFPTSAGAAGGQVAPAPEVLDGEVLSDEENAAVGRRFAGLDRLPPRVLVLVQVVAASPQAAQLKAVAAYRVRQAPRDVTRLCWFALRGHGRWIAKGWTWATHGDLRADARAARLAGDREARRSAQETIRADARARWDKLSSVARRGVGAALLVTFLAGVLALVDSQVARAEMWPWLATGLPRVFRTAI